MPNYQDVVAAGNPWAAWALTETSGTTFHPYIGSATLTGTNVDAYGLPGPFGSYNAVHVTNGSLITNALPPFAQFWTMEVWIWIDNPTASGNRILEYLGNNSAANGWGTFCPNTDTSLHIFYASPVRNTTEPYSFSTGAWHLLQTGNLSGITGEIDAAVDGQLVGTDVSPSALVRAAGSAGFGGAGSPASVFTGKFALPAIYITDQTFSNWQSRWVGSTDPNSGLVQSPAGLAQVLQQCCAFSKCTP